MKTNLKPLSSIKKLVFEFLSVSFAVFIALMANQWRDNYNNDKLAKQSINNIQEEIVDNKDVILKSITEHKQLLVFVDSIMPLINDDDIDSDSDSTIAVSFKLLNSTSWQTAQLTQSISYMDLNLVNKISKIYIYQEYYQEIIKDFILKNLVQKNVNIEYMEYIQNLLISIVPIEETLNDNYDKLLESISLLNNKKTKA